MQNAESELQIAKVKLKDGAFPSVAARPQVRRVRYSIPG